MAESENNQLHSAVTGEQSGRYRNTRSSKVLSENPISGIKNPRISKLSNLNASTQEYQKSVSKKGTNQRIKCSLNSKANPHNSTSNPRKRVLETDTAEAEKQTIEKVKRKKSLSTNIANRTRSQTIALSNVAQSNKNRQFTEEASTSASESVQFKLEKRQYKNSQSFKADLKVETFNKNKKLISSNKSSRNLRSSVVQYSNNPLKESYIKDNTVLDQAPKKKLCLSDPNISLSTRKKRKKTTSVQSNIKKPDKQKSLNLGSQLTRGSSGREPQHDTQGQLPSLLRRSSRTKSSTNIGTTASGASTSAQINILPSNSSQRPVSQSQGKGLYSIASTSKLQNTAGPSSSKSETNKLNAVSTMSDKNDNSNEEQSSNNPFIKLHKLSMPLLDVNSSFQQEIPSNSTNISNDNLTISGTTQHQDSESDDSEVGRLQALLEARGLPPQLFGALGPRMHHLLHRTMGTNSTSKAQTLLQALQSNDESQQLQAAIEMCQMLVMGNEDTLAGFPIKQVVPALIILLRMEHNFDLMMNACRALAYMLEALPRSSATVVDAIPAFLEKLQVIQWVDVAEQSLTALEILSRRHSKSILHANGVSACLTYLDFFSINAQRSALAVTANCCQSLHCEEFHHIKESLPLLARLLGQHDKKSVESICTVFSRLVDSFQNDSYYLKEVASMELLKNCQQLLTLTPPMLTSSTFTNVVRMLSIMSANCPDLATTLLKNDIAATLLYLLTGSTEAGNIELVTKSPSELYEITCLIGELMPRLPSDGIFNVDALLEKTQLGHHDMVLWQWKDDRGVWRSYSSIDCRMIEAAHMNSDEEINLTALGRTYTIDFNSMQQINEDSGTSRAVQRKINSNIPLNSISKATSLHDANQGKRNSNDCSSSSIVVNLTSRQARVDANRDIKIDCMKEDHSLFANFTKSLFGVLYEVYSSSAGPAVRYKCLRALLRMIYFANSNLLQEVLSSQLISAHIAGMMASNDVRIVIGAIQMAEILMQKLPDVFSIHFRREGVMHQMNYLADSSNPLYTGVSPYSERTNAPLSFPVSNMSFHIEQASTSKEHTKTSDSNKHSTTKMSVSIPSTSSSPFGTLQSTSLNSTNDFIVNLNVSDTGSPQIYRNTNADEVLISTTINDNTTPDIPNFSTTNSMIANDSSLNNQNTEENITRSQAVSDAIKRKIPSKRKIQSSSRSKNRIESSTISQTSSTCLKSKPSNATLDRNSPSTSGCSSKSRFSSGSSKTTSFLQSLNPVRWRRSTSQSSSIYKENANSISKCVSNSNMIATGNREKARQWIRKQSVSFIQRYADKDSNGIHPVVSILNRLKAAIQKLDGNLNDCIYSLRELKTIIIESDISPFEVNHSGLIKSLVNYMTNEDGIVDRDSRLRAFLHVFVALPLDGSFSGPPPLFDSNSLRALVTKLNACVTQLEQFPLKVHDFPAGFGGRSNTSALKFFNTHQLKCNLQRHPDCTNLRQWKGGTVKVDPLALVQAIERYLVVRGYGGIRVDSEDDSDEDIDNIDAAALATQGGAKHKLQFSIGSNILPYNMTVYQAIKQFSSSANDQSETDTDSETAIGNASIWVQQHTIHYRPVEEDSSCINGKNLSSFAKKTAKGSTLKFYKRKQDVLTDESINISPLKEFLTAKLPDTVTVQDSSMEVILLLRIINALNRFWNSLYYFVPQTYIINQSEFIHPKIAAKASRQLQDPLVIMTGNLPQWLQQMATACPFLFSFETRLLLFYAISFDRDRALQRLLEITPDLNSSDSTERVTPRLDRRKRPISRENILKQAELIFQDFGHSKALLEIQYEDEVGTGLGPTLEFYALVSTELQRCDLDLWNNSDSYTNQENEMTIIGNNIVKTESKRIQENCNTVSSIDQNHISPTISNETNQIDDINLHVENNTSVNSNGSQNTLIQQTDTTVIHSQENTNIARPNESKTSYVNSPTGLFPSPLGKNIKATQITRLKSKFRFLGKLMAKAVMDSRMLDLPFSIPFYRWLLGEEQTLGLADLHQVAPELQITLLRLNEIVKQRDLIQADTNLDELERIEKIEALNLDGCSIADLGLDFVLPGHSSIELKRGGKEISVTIHNLHQYILLVTHWFLFEGVAKQFEALREGFDTVFPLHRLKMFYPEELENVFCGTGINAYQKWEPKMLAECCRTDHGFSQESKAIQYFYNILSTYTKEEQRLFLQFVTGSPRLPTGGFKALSPPLTIVRKKIDVPLNPDDYLPSVMTCVNYLKLPDYTTREVMREKLQIAASEGRMCFHLS